VSRLIVSEVADVRFGGLQGLALDGLDIGFVVISGPNESGKSTLAEFISWMIAGPAGDAASASRYGDTASTVGGRLLGSLAGEQLDLQGSFTILARGAPRDVPNTGQRAPRFGSLGAVNIDGEQLLVRLGGLTPSAYSLLYRIGSETAHLLDSEDDLVDLFARYATGSISSAVNPRTVVTGLRDDISRTRTKLNALAGNSGRRAEVRRLLDEALARPGRIREIESEIVRLEGERKRVGEAVNGAAERLGDLRKAIDVFGRAEAAGAAERALDDAPGLPTDVAAIADDLDSVVDIAGRLDTARAAVASSEPEVTASCRAVGVDADTLAGHALTNADTQTFLAAASAITDKRKALGDAESARSLHDEQLRAARDRADICLSQGALDADVLRRRVLDADAVAALGHPAYAVDQAAREVGQRERALEAARARTGNGPEPGQKQRANPWSTVLPAVFGVVGAVLGGFANRGVSLVAGVAGLVVGIAVARVLGGRVTASGAGATDEVSAASAELERVRLDHAEKLATLNESLGAMGLPAVEGRGAVAHVGDIERALRALAEVGRLDSLTGALDAAVKEGSTGVTVAETTYARLFEQRGLSKVSEEVVPKWLDIYSDAIHNASNHTELVARCGTLEDELNLKTRGVARLSDGSSPSVIAERAREYIAVRDKRAEIAREAHRLRNEADIAMGERPQVRDLLQSGNQEVLQAEERSVESETAALEAERSDIDGNLGALRNELKDKNEGELVADLTEELGRIEDDIEELVREYTVLAAALEAIETVVGEYELRNQGPVIAEAQRLIASVDPAFGSLYVDRSTGEPRLMVDRAGRRLLVQRLSTGARALVYFALRLAFQTVDSQGRPVALPLICDDPLVTVDDRRVVPLMRLLQKVSEERQVIFLTCHERETTAARSIGARIIEMR
jgi:energy-coupling factor transporter ATP-binding protein EcfA2